ncbi:nucleic-acid-binding protein from mobile element jockey [Elysia marginata]|uniref:Nucleic-acid-binding protein from mobile element jockey n=1 Tax=Elysia marginata TaxID=1093978 RepID=A0AAV4JUX4_9GAST|nr:nucleic-acid-binding protein from mobile element jockey [Elysia marginata]
MIPTNSFILTFDSPTSPTQVKAGYVKLNVRPYVPTPMRCYKCHKFGHGREKCRRQDPICDKCGKVCPKYAEEQAILRYRAYNGGTFQQARAAVDLEVAKEVRPRTYAQVTKSTRAPVASAIAPDLSSKVQQVTPGTRGVTREKITAPTKKTRSEDRRAGRTSLPRPAPRQQSSPSQPPPRAPAPEETDSGGMDTDLGSALSADPRGCPLSPLVLIQPQRPPSPGPVKAAGGKRYVWQDLHLEACPRRR